MATIKEILRWVLILPVAIAAAWLANFIVKFGAMLMLGGGDIWFIWKICLEISSGLVMGVAFVYSGAKIAPRYRNKISYSLVVLTILAVSFALFSAFQVQNYLAMVNGGFVIIGAIITAFGVIEELTFT